MNNDPCSELNRQLTECKVSEREFALILEKAVASGEFDELSTAAKTMTDVLENIERSVVAYEAAIVLRGIESKLRLESGKLEPVLISVGGKTHAELLLACNASHIERLPLRIDELLQGVTEKSSYQTTAAFVVLTMQDLIFPREEGGRRFTRPLNIEEITKHFQHWELPLMLCQPEDVLYLALDPNIREKLYKQYPGLHNSIVTTYMEPLRYPGNPDHDPDIAFGIYASEPRIFEPKYIGITKEDVSYGNWSLQRMILCRLV